MRGLREVGFGICEREGERSYKMLSGLELKAWYGRETTREMIGWPSKMEGRPGKWGVGWVGGGGAWRWSIGSMDNFFFLLLLPCHVRLKMIPWGDCPMENLVHCGFIRFWPSLAMGPPHHNLSVCVWGWYVTCLILIGKYHGTVGNELSSSQKDSKRMRSL